MKTVRVPAFLHDVFGEKPTVLNLGLVLLTGFGLSVAWGVQFQELLKARPLWCSLLAWLLIFDIAAGCIANFTSSTSRYYWRNPGKQLIFLAVHVHLLLIALLLGEGLLYAAAVWGYTIVGALLVVRLQGEQQLVTAGVLLAVGLAGAAIAPFVVSPMVMASLLFILKVLFSFSVNHYKARGENAQ